MAKSTILTSDDPSIWHIPTRKGSKYRYLIGDNKHPYEWKACLCCGVESWIQVRRDYCSYKCSKTGPLNPKWKGDEAGYISYHARVYRERGKASSCSVCGEDNPDVRYEWANLTGRYEDVNDYAEMCKQCHVTYDKSRKPNNGRWVYTDEILAIADEMRQTMTLKAVAEELGLDATNISKYLGPKTPR